MWHNIARFILRFQYPLLAIVIVGTLIMAYFAPKVQMDYNFGKIIPVKEPANLAYQAFKKQFGEDGSVLVIAVENNPLFEKEFYNQWFSLGKKIDSIEDIDEVVSIAHLYYLNKNKEEKKFELKVLCNEAAPDQNFLDSIAQKVYALKFYEDILWKKDNNVTIMAVRINEKKMASKRRITIVTEIEDLVKKFEEQTGKNLHISGLPFIRTYKVKATQKELYRVLIISLTVLIIVLLLLFRSFLAIAFPILISVIGVVIALGLMAVLDYKVTILTAIVPNLIVIIGIPNCVYMLNKYYIEIRKHGNKIRALTKIIEFIGYSLFFANLTTAIGFGVFYFTGSVVLEEFGVISFVMVMLMYTITLMIIPIILNILPMPKDRAMMHLESKNMAWTLRVLENAGINHPKKVYAFTLVLIAFSLYGTTKLYTQGYILDDIPKDEIAYRDLKYFEQRFKGVMPVEILVDTKKKGGATNMGFLKKMNEAQDALFANKLFSKPTSMINALKFSTQAYYNNNPNQYRLPKDNILTPELSFIYQYLNNSGNKSGSQFSKAFIDSNKQLARITVQIPDIGSQRLPELYATLDTILNPIFPKDEYKITYTGTSIVALEGYNYLVGGLVESVLWALFIIGIVMFFILRKPKMLIMGMIPNLIPLFLTAGIMGYFNIPIKPTTVLVFSIAYGMSSDFTIHFLNKYRRELARHQWDVAKTINDTIFDMGFSMLYTTIILCLGFGCLVVSDFDGTKYLGVLISITLFSSLFSNLVLLPAMLMSFDKPINLRFKLKLRRRKRNTI